MQKITEQESKYNHLEKMPTSELLKNINAEDKTVPLAVEKALPQIEIVVEQAFSQLEKGGRLFYLGAGTSGRLGVVDASECPPTFGVANDIVIGLIAGGDKAIRKAVEFAEDDLEQAWKDLQLYTINSNDFVIGIAASGTTPYVLGALNTCKLHNIPTACIVCNAESPIAKAAKYPIECIVGPEFVTGSSRMKAGTAQKLILNMISTSVMIKGGKISGNKMVDMQLSNDKLITRGTQMIQDETRVDTQTAKEMLLKFGSVRAAIMHLKNK